MFDIGKQKFDFKCPNCGKTHAISFEDVQKKRTISCSCGKNLKLVADGTVKKTVDSINKSFGELENMIKRLGK